MAIGKTITINNHLYVTENAVPIDNEFSYIGSTLYASIYWNTQVRMGVQTAVEAIFSAVPFEDVTSQVTITVTAGDSLTMHFTPPSGYTIIGLDDLVFASNHTYELNFKVIDDNKILCYHYAL